jgi:S1-C subfamily serine protease
MGFMREEYQKAQRRKRIITVSSIFLIVVVVIWFGLLKKSPVEETEPPTAGKKPGISKTEASRRQKQKSPEKKDLPAIVKEVKKAVVVIHTFDKEGNPLGQGSGFFINEHGHIVSNRHVFRGAKRAEVKIPRGTYPVRKILAEDAENDLILFSVSIKSSYYTPLPIDYKLPEVGESIVVIGNPLGLEATVSNGIVSACRKLEPFGSVIQITSPISPGSSGSPVLNMQGEVIGVATFQYRIGQNLNFAVPISKAKKLIPAGEKEVSELSFADPGLLASANEGFPRGKVYYDAGEYENAVSEFQQAIKKNPANAEAYFYLGMCYKESHSTDAVDAFKTAVSIKPGYAEAYCNLGIVYIKLNMHKEAAAALREAIEINPNYSEALLNLGIAYALGKEYRAAVNVLERSVDMGVNPKTYYYLGLCYAELKMRGKAIDAFQEAVNLDSEFIEAYIGLASGYAAVKNWKRGIRLLNRAVISAPLNPEIHFLLSLMHLGNNDLDSAEHEYRLLKNIRNALGIEKLSKEEKAAYSKKISKYMSELDKAIRQYKYSKNRRYR